MKAHLILLPTAMLFIHTSGTFSTSWESRSTEQAIAQMKTVAAAEFSFLRTHKQGTGITATWAVTVPQEVVEFTVQRTYEDPTDEYAVWENVATIQGNTDRSSKYTDENVFPGSSHYRVIATLTDGSTIASEISSVRIQSKG